MGGLEGQNKNSIKPKQKPNKVFWNKENKKKKIQQENFSSLKNCTLEVEVNFYLHFYWLISKLEDELKINLNCA